MAWDDDAYYETELEIPSGRYGKLIAIPGGPGPSGPPGPQGEPGADSTVPGPQGEPGVAGISADLENATTTGTDGLVYTASSVVGREVLVAADEQSARTAIEASQLSVDGVFTDAFDLDSTPLTASDVGAYTRAEVDDLLESAKSGPVLTNPVLVNWDASVGGTAIGGNTAANGADTWAKLVTIKVFDAYQDTCVMLGVVGSVDSSAPAETAIVVANARTVALNANPVGDVQIISYTGNAIAANSFKLVCGAGPATATSSSTFELWMRKTSQYNRFQVFELGRSISTAGKGEIVYGKAAAWQAAEPTGTTVNARSAGVIAGGAPVVTTTGTQTLSGKTLMDPIVNYIRDAFGMVAISVPATAVTLEGYDDAQDDPKGQPRLASNWLEVLNSAAGIPIRIAARGADTDIPFFIAPKNAGPAGIYVNTGLTAVLTAAGPDENHDLNLKGKGPTGKVLANGSEIASVAGAQTITNKRITPRTFTVPSTPALSIDCAIVDQYSVTALGSAIEVTITGTPTDGQRVVVRIKDAGTARAVTWAANIVGNLLTTTVANKTHLVELVYDANVSKWACLRSDPTGY